jgi:hypothetical protein
MVRLIARARCGPGNRAKSRGAVGEQALVGDDAGYRSPLQRFARRKVRAVNIMSFVRTGPIVLKSIWP